jgi:putative selenium metabolism hydrolase
MSDTDLITFTQSLIRCPSPPGEEGAVVDVILAEMRALGFDGFWRDDVGNAVGVILGTGPGPTLLLDSHCDTVGIAPGVPWRHDPFGAEIEDGYIYGRGSADMKGALAAMIHAAAGVDRSRLRGRVVVTATVMEENLEGAALKAVMDAVPPAFVVIGEASELRLVRGGRGRAEIHLETIGRPAHSSTPHLGRNAVLAMLPVIQALARLPVPEDPFLGPGILALTDIISDPYPAYSVIPSRCRVTYDRRLLAGETEADVMAAFAIENLRSLADPTSGTARENLRGLPDLEGLNDVELRAAIAQGEHTTYTGAVLRGPKFLPAWLLAETDPFVRAALRGLRAAGLDPAFGAYRFCTNAAYSAGTAGVPTVGFGPGREQDAHVIDERLSIEELLAAERGYGGIITSALGGVDLT